MRIRYILRCLFYYIVETRFRSFSKIENETKELLIVYTDAIGDYILFRNFIQVLKQSDRYKNYRITLCGNQAFKDLATHFDATVIDAFVWLDRGKFGRDFSYRQLFLKSIRKQKFDIVFNPSFSRDFVFADSIVRQVNATVKIGQVANTANTYKLFTLLSDKWYSKLVKIEDTVLFEFFRNQKFIENLIGEDSRIVKPFLPIQSSSEAFLIIFPGAGEKQKQWNTASFIQLAIHIAKKDNLNIVICGSSVDIFLGEEIKGQLNLKSTKNLCGKTSLIELAQLISKASFLLTNDSSAVHIAACTNTPTICIGNGRHYGRFTPYPTGMAPNLHFVFPEKVTVMANENLEKLKKLTIKQSIASINDIKVDDVIHLYNQIIK